jgi:integrase
MGKPVGLTVKEILALVPRTAPYEVRDTAVTGGYVVKWPSGAVSYVLRYRYQGKKAKLTIGVFQPEAKGGLAGVRGKALKALGQLAEARNPKSDVLLDPASAKRAAKLVKVKSVREAKQPQRDNVEKVVSAFVERHCSQLRTGAEVARVLKKELVTRWKGRGLGEISKADVHDLLDTLVDRGAAIQANRVLAYLNKLCRWAMSRGLIDRNPCDGIDRPAQEKSRDRVLDDNELALVWRGAEKIGWPFEQIVKLLILTGARRGEISDGRWGEVDIESKCWSLPPDRVKNKRPHVIPLSPQALATIEKLPRLAGSKAYLFTTTSQTSVSGFSRMKRNLDEAIAELNGGQPLADWTLHDLRRSVASGLAKIGIDLVVIERTLNHVSGSFGGIVSVYQHHQFEPEKRAALERWAEHVERIVEGTTTHNVT